MLRDTRLAERPQFIADARPRGLNRLHNRQKNLLPQPLNLLARQDAEIRLDAAVRLPQESARQQLRQQLLLIRRHARRVEIRLNQPNQQCAQLPHVWLVQLEQILHRTVPEVLQAEPTEAIVVHRAIVIPRQIMPVLQLAREAHQVIRPAIRMIRPQRHFRRIRQCRRAAVDEPPEQARHGHITADEADGANLLLVRHQLPDNLA